MDLLMTEVLINDVIYTILIHVPLEDVLKFSRIDRRFLEVCRSERGRKEIERKYYDTLIDEILSIAGITLFEIIKRDYISYLSSQAYINFATEIYKTEENVYIIALLCSYFSIYTIKFVLDKYKSIFPNMEISLMKENQNVLKEFLYYNKHIIKRLRTEINDIILRFNERSIIDEVD